jgi:hypothetical protein
MTKAERRAVQELQRSQSIWITAGENWPLYPPSLVPPHSNK